jgi:hypothetical protein
VVREAGLVHDGYVVMTVATYGFVEAAELWFHALRAKGVHSGVVVALDWGAYKYLVNRGVPAVLLPTIIHLDVCCLRRFRMVPWRSASDVKVQCFLLCACVGAMDPYEYLRECL